MACILCSIAFTVAHGQINESDTAKMQLKTTLFGNMQSGNVSVLAIRSKLDWVTKRRGDFVFKTQNASLYQSFSNRKADNDLFSRNYFYYKPHNALYPYAIAFLSTNYRRKIDFRYFAGAGITYQVLNRRQHIIKASVNTVFEQSQFNTLLYNDADYNGRSTIDLWRGTAYMAGMHYFLDRKLKLFYDAFYQAAFNDAMNYRTQIDAGIEMTLWKGLGVSFTYVSAFDSVVALNAKKKDTLLAFGLSYTFKKI